jgi:ADP-ribose pyrophosphatase YjhB (NUDIX family)
VAEPGNRGGQRRRSRRRRARVEKSSGGVVFRRTGGETHFLLIRNPYENWGLPTGHIEGDESPEDAALREVTEETGLSSLTLIRELPTIDWYFRDRGRLIHKFCHFYLVESPGGDVCPQLAEGITECIWRTFDIALSTVTYENARAVLRAAGEWLAENGDPDSAGT